MNTRYHEAAGSTPHAGDLAPHHRETLIKESGIHPDVVAERGYHTIGRRSEFPPGFGKNKRRVPALAIPVRSPDGETGFVRVRHDTPRPAYKRKGERWVRDGAARYDQPTGQGIVLDVHPRSAERVKEADADLWITEGEKKGDALTSRGLCAVALFGVDCWGRGGELLPCWDHVALAGRAVYVVYDSDVVAKPEVQDALQRLVGALEARRATVRVVYLPDAEDGSRQGVDDFLVAGGEVEDLYGLARPFKPSDYAEVRLSRDERLRAALHTAWGIHEAMPTKTLRDCTHRAVYRSHLQKAARHGKGREDGSVAYHLASNEGAICVNLSQPTFSRHTTALEHEGLLLIERPEDPAKANTYVLLPDPVGFGNNNGGRAGWRGESGCQNGGRTPLAGAPSSHRDSQIPHAQGEVPELRHSRVIVSWRMDEFGRRVCEVDPLARTNPKRREILVHLLTHGRTSKRVLMERFASDKATWRDFRRDVLGPLIEHFPIVELEGNLVGLREGWREALDHAREIGQEPEDQHKQIVSYELNRAAFRARDRDQASAHPANAGGDGWVEDLEELPDPPDLTGMVGRRVRTPHGPGILWDHKADEARVVLDSKPDVVTFLDPVELIVEAALTFDVAG